MWMNTERVLEVVDESIRHDALEIAANDEAQIFHFVTKL